MKCLINYSLTQPIYFTPYNGKDSTILLYLMDQIRQRSKIKFTVDGVMLDQKQPGFDAGAYCEWMAKQGLNIKIISRDTYSVVTEKTPEGKSFCSLCSRFRRGILYDYAHDKGYTKMALGHHRDDLNQTLLLNLFFSGKIASMPPNLLSKDKRNIVLRPLAYVPEELIVEYQNELRFPVIPCNLCGSQENLQRQKMKAMIKNLEQDVPNVANTMLNAQKNIQQSLLLDTELWDFDELAVEREEQGV
ncbi:MAG: tRNA 2-thiocytidine(32) synthetase TtcA [Lentisphaeraceae bacterium]|nr:tRNA 2-thiocytidine(32) synthetase TtcA [Lentisphaeraceae bacterium]